MSRDVIRVFGGPMDGMELPRVRGYFREGEAEYIDGVDKQTGLPIAPAFYIMRGGDLHFVHEAEPVDPPAPRTQEDSRNA